MTEQDFEETSLVIRWGCTSNLMNKVPVLNTAEAIHRVSDKAGFRQLLWTKEEWREIIPFTFFDGEEADASEELELGMKLFVRPKVHSQGKNAHVVSNEQEFQQAIEKCGPGWYASEFINKVAEYRVFAVCGRVVWVANKTPANPEIPVWNVAQGGKFENVKWGSWNLKVCDAALKALEVSGLHFGGVDVMVDKNGKPYVIEINSAPSQTSPYRQQCVAKAFDYIVRNGKELLTVNNHFNNWKDYIHPGVWKG